MEIVKFKVMFNRVKEYLNAIQFMMVAYLFIVGTEFNLITTAFAILLISGLIGIADFKYILPREYKIVSYKNPVTHEFLKRFDGIEETLKKMSGNDKWTEEKP